MKNTTTATQNWRIFKRKKSVLTGYTAMVALAGLMAANTNDAFAAPTGGVVDSGDAAISIGKDTIIDQHSSRIDVKWDTFSTDADESITFNQIPTDVAINRVLGGQESRLAGKLTAAGSIYILNSAGVTFTGSSQVNVGALLATTASDLSISGDKYSFAGTGEGAVINKGEIKVSDGGFAVLAAPYVENTGVIVADLGQVNLASTNNFALDLRGDNLVTFTVSEENLEKIGVKNSGTLQAKSGTVAIDTKIVSDIVYDVVNLGGVIDASALEAGKNGGKVLVSSEAGHIIFDNATVKADGGTDGKGGTVITRAMQGLNFFDADSSISATGGSEAGDGGFIDLSAALVSVEGKIDASAENGEAGTFLLDPTTLRILNGHRGSSVTTTDGSTSTSGGSFGGDVGTETNLDGSTRFNDFITENRISGTSNSNGVFGIHEGTIEKIASLGINVRLEATDLISMDNLTDNTLNVSGVDFELKTTAASGKIEFSDKNDKILGTTGTVKLTSGTGGIDIGTIEQTTGAINLTSTGDVKTKALTGGNIDISSANATLGALDGNNIDVDGDTVTLNGEVDGNDITITADTVTAEDLDIDGTGDVSIAASGKIDVSGSVLINGVLSVTTGNIDPTDITITSGGNILTGSLVAGSAGEDGEESTITVESTGGSVTTGSITLTSTFGDTNLLDIDAGTSVNVTGDINVTVTDGTTAADFATAVVDIKAGTTVDTKNITVSATDPEGNLAHIATATLDIEATAGSVKTGNISVTADALNGTDEATARAKIIAGTSIDTGDVTVARTADTVAEGDIDFTANTGLIKTGTLLADRDVLLNAGTSVETLNATAKSGKIDIDALGGNAKTGALQAQTDVNVDATGTITTGDVVATTGLVDLEGGSTIVTDNITADDTIDVKGSGNVDTKSVKNVPSSPVGGAQGSTKNITVVSTSGNITTVGDILGGNDVTYTAGKTIEVDYVEAAANLVFTSGDDIFTNNLKAGNDVTLDAGNQSNDDVKTGSINAGNNVDIDAGGNVRTDGNIANTFEKIDANGIVDIFAGKAITTGDIDPIDIILNASGNITTGVLVASRDITVNSTNGSVNTGDITITNTIGDDSTLDIDAKKNVTTGIINVSVEDTTTEGIDAQAYVDIHAGRDVKTKSITVTATDNQGTARDAIATLEIDGDNVDVDGDVNVTATSSRGFGSSAATANAGVDIEATDGDIDAGNITVTRTATGYGAVNNGGDILLNASSDITTASLTAPGAISAYAGDEVTVNGNIQAGNDVSLNAGYGESFGEAILEAIFGSDDDVHVNGTTTSTNGSIAITADDDITTFELTADNSVTLNAGDDVNVAGKIDANDTVSIEAGDSITTQAIDPTMITLTSWGSGITTGDLAASKDIFITAHGAGDVTTGSITIENLIGGTSTLDIYAGDNLNVNGDISVVVEDNTVDEIIDAQAIVNIEAGDDIQFGYVTNEQVGGFGEEEEPVYGDVTHGGNITVSATDNEGNTRYANAVLNVDIDHHLFNFGYSSPANITVLGDVNVSATAERGFNDEYASYGDVTAHAAANIDAKHSVFLNGSTNVSADAHTNYSGNAYATSALNIEADDGEIVSNYTGSHADATTGNGESEGEGYAEAASSLYMVAVGDVTVTGNIESTANAASNSWGSAEAGADLIVGAGFYEIESGKYCLDFDTADFADLNITGDITTDADANAVNGYATGYANTVLVASDDVTITTADETLATTADAHATGEYAGNADAGAELYVYAGDETAKSYEYEGDYHEPVYDGETLITPGYYETVSGGDGEDNDLVINGHTLVEANASTTASGTYEWVEGETQYQPVYTYCNGGFGCDSVGSPLQDEDVYGYAVYHMGDIVSTSYETVQGESYLDFIPAEANASGTAFLGADNNVTLNGDTEVNAGAFTGEGGDAEATAHLEAIAGLGEYLGGGAENPQFSFGDEGDMTITGKFGTHAVDSGSSLPEYEGQPALATAFTLAAAPDGNALNLFGPAPYAWANNAEVRQYFTGFDSDGYDTATLILRPDATTSSSSSSSSGGGSTSSSGGSSSSGGDGGSSGSSSGVINPGDQGDNPSFSNILSLLSSLKAYRNQFEEPGVDGLAPAAGDDVEGQFCEKVNTSKSAICSKKGDVI